MKSYLPFTVANSYEKQQVRLRYADQLRRRGTERLPDPPRDLCAQPGSRSALVTWKLPVNHDDIAGWQVAKGVESNVICSTEQRQYEVSLSTGAAPPPVTVFVRAINASGIPSAWASVVAKAAVETAGSAPPPAPVVPPGYTTENAGGEPVGGPIGGGKLGGL